MFVSDFHHDPYLGKGLRKRTDGKQKKGMHDDFE